MTFDVLFDRWWPSKSSEVRRSTANSYLLSWNSVKPIIGSVDVSVFGRRDAQFLLGKLIESGLSAKSCRDRIALVRMMLNAALQDFAIIILPTDWQLKYPAAKPRLIKSFTREESKKIVCRLYADADSLAPSVAAVAISLLAGLRIGETCGLKWSDFDFAHGTFSVKRTVNHIYNPLEKKCESLVGAPKSAAGFREVPLHPILKKILRKFFGDPKSLSGYVLSGDSKPYTPHVVRDAFERFRDRNRLPKINFHGLRHTFATILIEAGVDVKVVSDIIGHADVSTTYNLYVHPSADSKRKAVAKAFRGFKLEGGEA